MVSLEMQSPVPITPEYKRELWEQLAHLEALLESASSDALPTEKLKIPLNENSSLFRRESAPSPDRSVPLEDHSAPRPTLVCAFFSQSQEIQI